MDGLHKESLRKNRPSKPLSGVMSRAFFSYEFPMVQGPIIFPTHPSESNIEKKFGLLLYFISKKKTERKVCEQSLVLHVLTCKSHLAGPPGKYQGNFKLVTLRRDIRRAKPSRVFDTQLVVLIQNLGDQFPWNPCDW